MSDISKVTVLGTGVLGAQIAFQAAYSGFQVTAWDISEAALELGGVDCRKLFDEEVDVVCAAIKRNGEKKNMGWIKISDEISTNKKIARLAVYRGWL